MKKEQKRVFLKEHPLISRSIEILIIVLGFLVVLTYYFNFYTKIVDIILTIILLVLGLDSLLYVKHTKSYKKEYLISSSILIILSIMHSLRVFYGAWHCQFNSLISVYLYDSIALIFGIILFSTSFYLIKEKSKIRYHHIAGILVGLVMILNHTFKLIVGKCV